MNEIEIFNETEEVVEEIEEMKKVIEKAIKHECLHNLEFSIIIVDNEKIREINREYRKIDKVTDVITFALEDEKEMIVKSDTRVLGDIYISMDRAKEQAKEYGHSLKRELCFLAVHGFLHLLGYDHMKEDDEKVMFGLQKEILDECNIVR